MNKSSVIADETPRKCAEVHKQIEGFMRADLQGFENTGRWKFVERRYQCGGCGRIFNTEGLLDCHPHDLNQCGRK